MIRVIRSAGEMPDRIGRLPVAEFGQARIDDARIAPRRAEMQVELALAVAQQDHGRGNTGRFRGRQPAGVRELFVSRAMRAYLWPEGEH